MLNNTTKFAILSFPLLDTVTFFVLGGDTVKETLGVGYFQWITVSLANTAVLVLQVTLFVLLIGISIKKLNPYHFSKTLNYIILINCFMAVLSTITILGFKYV
jgi:hypothetical protein